MVRGKTQVRRIENATSRQVTFSKRRNGLMKKAYELSVLCDVEVALIVFSTKGRLYEFASTSMQMTIDRYLKHSQDININSLPPQDINQWKLEASRMARQIEVLETTQRNLIGEGLEAFSLDQLQELEQRLEQSLKSIRGRKSQLIGDQISQLREKERALLEENVALRKQVLQQQRLPMLDAPPPLEPASNEDRSDVETELAIGIGGR